MKRITVAVEDDTHAALKVLAKEDGRALLEYVKRVLQAHAARKAKTDA